MQAAQRAILLTGTPALSRPIEMLTLLQGLMPSAKLTLKAFSERYCRDPNAAQYCRFPGQQYKGAQNMEELNKLLTGTVMIRRKKVEVNLIQSSSRS